MINRPIPRPRKIEERDGYLCAAPRYSVKEDSFKRVLAAFSEFCDRLWGLELKPSDEEIPDERYFTPLTEAGEFEAPDIPAADASLVALPGEERSRILYRLRQVSRFRRV